MNIFNRLKKSTEGATTLEFVIVLPFLLAIMFGIMDVSYIFFVRHEMESASRSAAREYAIFDGTSALAKTAANNDLTNLPATGAKPTVNTCAINGTPDRVVVSIQSNVQSATMTGMMPLANIPLWATTSLVPDWNITASSGTASTASDGTLRCTASN